MRQHKALGYAAGLAAVVIWSSVYSLKVVMLERLSPVEIVFLQYLGTTVLLGLLALLWGQRLRIGWKNAGKLVAVGAVGVALFQLLVTLGIAMVGSVTASVFSALLPAMCMIVDVVVLRKWWGRLGWLGIALSFAGILLVVGGAPLAGGQVLGYVLLLGSNAVWIFYCYCNQRLQGEYDGVVLLFYQSMSVVLALLPAVAAGGFRGLPALADPALALQVLFLSAVNGVAAYLLLNFTIRTLDVVVSNILFNFVPVVTILIEWALYGKAISAAQLLGVAMVIVSAILPNLALGKLLKKDLPNHEDGAIIRDKKNS